MYLETKLPQQEQETKTFTPDLEGLIAWLETQDPTTKYCYQNNRDCLLHRFFSACGLEVRRVGGMTYTLATGDVRLISNAFDEVSHSRPHVYSSALTRARALGRVGK